jgi:hypothetical protein
VFLFLVIFKSLHFSGGGFGRVLSLTSELSPDLFVSALASIEEISFLESLIASLSLA